MNQQRQSSFGQCNSGPGFITSSGAGGQGFPVGGSGSPMPPPIPPRVPASTGYQASGLNGGYGMGNSFNYNRLGMGGGYGSMYGGYGSGYGGYGGYGGLGGYGRFGNSYGMQTPGYSQLGNPSGDVENRFLQFAEESSRPAFQSIESVVNTFSSIAVMLESTFFALTSSFRAILSVAENAGRVKSMFGQLFNTFALIRFLKWLYRKIAYTLGFDPEDPSTEQVWRKTAVEVINGEKRGPATWPIIVFISMLIAIPYMINKLVNRVRQQVDINVNNPKDWFRYNEPVYSAIALYDFVAASNEELNIKAGQKIWLAPQTVQSKNSRGWSTATDGNNVGLVPSNYVKIIGELKKKSESTDAMPVSSDKNAQSMVSEYDVDSPHKSEDSPGLDKVSNESHKALFQ